jgi:protein-S-isoprenylcysteine O-methyltransferase Ste14
VADRDVAGVPLPPPLIYVLGLVAGALMELVRSTSVPPWPVTVPVVVIGAGLWFWLDGESSIRFSRAGTAVIPFKPTTALVTGGAYRFTRNPIYLGMATLYVALAVGLGILWSFLFLPFVLLAVDRFVIVREERYLERKFGQQYTEYRRRVRRWI